MHIALHSLNAVRDWPGFATRMPPYSIAGPNSLWHIGKSLPQVEIRRY